MKTLSNGIIIDDARHIQCGVMIKNQNTKFVRLYYDSIDGFGITIRGTFREKDLLQLETELKEIKKVFNECIV